MADWGMGGRRAIRWKTAPLRRARLVAFGFDVIFLSAQRQTLCAAAGIKLAMQRTSERAMAEYRLYFVDAEGRRTGCAEFSSTDDQRALVEAQKLVVEAGAELWRGSHWMNTWVVEGDDAKSISSHPLPQKTPSGNRQRAAQSGWTRRRSSGEAGAASARERTKLVP
jgi:hypothetical protein